MVSRSPRLRRRNAEPGWIVVSLLLTSARVSAFAFGPFVSNARDHSFGRATLSRLRDQTNPFQFEPSPELARALGVADPEHPHPPKTPPPQDLLDRYNNNSREGPPSHATPSTVPFFLLDRDEATTVETSGSPPGSPDEADDTFLDVTATADDESFSSWTVVQLKAELRRRNLPVSGRKAQLIERLEASLQQQVQATVVPSSTSASTVVTEAAWTTVLDPWIQARLKKGVQPESIQGALVAGTAITAVASKSVAVSSVVGLLAAYTAITEGSVGTWTRQVGRVVWDAVVAATDVVRPMEGSAASPVQLLLGQSISLVGTLVNKTISSVESGIAAASLAQEMEQMEAANRDRMLLEETRTMPETSVEPQLPTLTLVEPQVPTATTGPSPLEAEALMAAKKRQTAFLQTLMVERFEMEARARKERFKELVRQEKEVQLAKALETSRRQTAFRESLMAARFAIEARERAALLEEQARREEEARVAEENERLRLTKLIEERARMEEEAKAIAAEEAARLAAEAAPEMADEISEEDWLASIRVAQKSIEGKMAGFDMDSLYVDQEDKDNWEKAEQLAEQLGEEDDFTDAIDDFDLDSVDINALGDAARAAVEEFEKMRAPLEEPDGAADVDDARTTDTRSNSLPVDNLVDMEEEQQVEVRIDGLANENLELDVLPDIASVDGENKLSTSSAQSFWSSMNLSQLREECKARNLSVVGKKADLLARLEQAAMENVDGLDSDSVPLDLLAAEPAVSWSTLKLGQLRDACSARGLSTVGKKMDLVARLEQSEGLMGSDEDEMDDLDEFDFESIDIDALGEAARAAVEDYSQATESSTTPLNWSLLSLPELREECELRGLSSVGSKEDLASRLEEYESVSLFSDDLDLLSDSEDDLDLDTEPSVGDWDQLSVKELQQELQQRNLPTTGSKADLVATLEAFTAADNYVDEDDLDADLEELALRYGNANENDSDGDLDIDFDSIDLDAIGEAARQAVNLFSAEQIEEPTDEDLWEIENMNLADSKDEASSDTALIGYLKMTINELKDELRERGLSVTGKKSVLIERLMSSDPSR